MAIHLVRDAKVFQCPVRIGEAGGSQNIGRRESHYRWEQHPDSVPELGGQRRGTRCLWCQPEPIEESPSPAPAEATPTR